MNSAGVITTVAISTKIVRATPKTITFARSIVLACVALCASAKLMLAFKPRRSSFSPNVTTVWTSGSERMICVNGMLTMRRARATKSEIPFMRLTLAMVEFCASMLVKWPGSRTPTSRDGVV